VSAPLVVAALAVAAVAGAGPGCGREPAVPPAATATTTAGATAAPPQAKSKIPPYSFELEPKELDLGTLRPDQDGKCDFTIVNTDARPMRVLNLDGSCECTSFTYDRTEIPPGGRRVVHVVVHAQNRGAKRLYALVQAYDSAVTTKQIDFHYIVLAELSFAPAEVSFGRRVVGSDAAADVVLHYQQSASGKLLALAPKLDHPDLPLRWTFGEPKTTEAADVREVSVPIHLALDASQPVPPFRALLVFDSESHLPARLVVSGEVHPGWYLDPSQLQWVAKVGTKSRATVRLAWTTAEAPKIEALEPSDPALTATSAPEAGGRSLRIDVAFEPTKAGEFAGELRVKIDRAAAPLVVRCKATVR
jgi:hypothetical protein